MSIRSVFVVNASKQDLGEILFYRLFPTAEKLCKQFLGSKYVRVPSPQLFVDNLLIKLGLSVSSKQFVEWRDKANENMQFPVISVKVGESEIWPVIAIVQQSLIACCLPLLESSDSSIKDDLLQIPSISVGFSVLLGILNFFLLKSNEEKVSKLLELDNFLSLTMPFGRPADVEVSCLFLLKSTYPQNYSRRQPAWKPVDFKGKQSIQIRVAEFVRCTLAEQKTSIKHYEVFGQVSVKAELEGLNDVSLAVTSSNSSKPLSLDSVLVHPCVQIHGAALSTTATNLLRRLRFTPPLHEFILLQYCSPDTQELPIQGVFKMLGENTVELLLQLKINDQIKNNFEYLNVIVVFFNRGPVKTFEYSTNFGMLKLSDDKHSIKWNIGSKLPKELEIAVTAKLDFSDQPILPNSDPFCIDKNCYAQVNFKLNNTTLSGCNIDPKSVIVSQNAKPKITIERSVEPIEYRLWNNYGDLPFPVNISSKFEKFSAS